MLTLVKEATVLSSSREEAKRTFSAVGGTPVPLLTDPIISHKENCSNGSYRPDPSSLRDLFEVDGSMATSSDQSEMSRANPAL